MGNTRTETRSAWRGRDREREKESDGVLGRARQLRLPTMAAQGGLHLRRGRGQDEVIISSFSVPSFGFQGSPSRGRVPGAPRSCFEVEDHPWLRDGDTAVRFRAFCILVGEL